MKVSFRPREGSLLEGGEVFFQKIQPKHVVERIPTLHRSKLYVRKTGRLVDIRFPCVIAGEKHNGQITLTEAEIFQLANLCRRGRSDEAILKAIHTASGTDADLAEKHPLTAID
ncbi:hypothetical protein [Croceicoccus marinus]|uniref:hypothetical protein n=1 Tax=Croceicoccus marinus TaxID=450378 RepID=UPI0012F9C9A5|nr:hypothetical protein [Croceicoccus marinus]